MNRLTATVVVCTTSHERKDLLHGCVRSLLAATRRPEQILVVVDQNPSLREELSRSLPSTVTVLATTVPGNSEGRNVGIRAAREDIVAFVDDDAVVEPNWLAALMAPFEASDAILGVGGAVIPEWLSERRWLPDELLWVVGCTYQGHRHEPGPIRNPIGCNMAFRTEALTAAGSFATEFGKRGNALVICDETELSLRLAQAHGPGRIWYAPEARVRHMVTPGRVSWRGLVRRCLTEGLSKGRLHQRYRDAAISRERVYVRRLLLDAVPRLLWRAAARRDVQAALGATAIVLSLSVTSVAFIVGLAIGAREARPTAGGNQ